MMVRMLHMGLAGATVGLAALAQAGPLEIGDRLGQMGVASVLGAVAVVCVCGMVRLSRERTAAEHAHIDDLNTVVKSNTEAMTKNTAVLEQVVGVQVETKNALIRLESQGGGRQ